jgi:hypothetical protein
VAVRYLPEARSRLLAVAAALIALFYAGLAVAFAVNVMRMPVGLVISPLFALLAWGMWKLARFARWVTIIWIWIMVIVMPLGVFMPHGSPDAPYWGTMLAAVTPFVVAGLFFIYVFGKHKREFKWP